MPDSLTPPTPTQDSQAPYLIESGFIGAAATGDGVLVAYADAIPHPQGLRDSINVFDSIKEQDTGIEIPIDAIPNVIAMLQGILKTLGREVS